MRSVTRNLALVLVVGLLVTGCVTSSPTRDGRPASAPDLTLPGVGFDVDLRSGPGTVLYLLAGPQPTSSDVYQLDPATGEAQRLTRSRPNFGISFVSASPDTIVIADATTGRDQLMVIQAGHKTPLRGEPPGARGFSPELSPDGSLAYQRVRYAKDQRGVSARHELVIRDRVDAMPRVVFSSERVPGITVWGPDGRVVFPLLPSRHEPDAPIEIVMLDPATGKHERLRPRLEQPTSVVGHPDANAVAVNDFASNAAELLYPRLRRWRPLPQGWLALCFHPSGDELLVGHGNKLGLLSLDDPTRVRPIGSTRGGRVTRCSWVKATRTRQ